MTVIVTSNNLDMIVIFVDRIESLLQNVYLTSTINYYVFIFTICAGVHEALSWFYVADTGASIISQQHLFFPNSIMLQTNKSIMYSIDNKCLFEFYSRFRCSVLLYMYWSQKNLNILKGFELNFWRMTSLLVNSTQQNPLLIEYLACAVSTCS